MAVKVRKESQPRIRLKGANSSTVGDGILLGTGDGNRTSMTFTATAEPVIVIPEGPVTNVQLEAGSFATSYIPNNATSGTVTRSPDIASIPVSAFGYNQEAGTVVVEYQAQEFTNETVWSLSDGTTSNRIQHTRLPTTYDLFVMYGGNIQALIRPNPTGSHSKVSTAFKDDSFSIAVGGTLGVPDTSGTVPIVNQMYLGSLNNVTEFLNGHIKSIKYYPRRLTDAQLQTLTS